MEAGQEMNEISKEQAVVREYLLGNLSDEEKMREIEENLLLDDDFDEQLSIAEDELMDEYLSGTLTEPERKSFLEFFLISSERKEKLRLIGNLRKYAASPASIEKVKESPRNKTARFNWRGLFSSPAWRFAAIALLVFGFTFGIWLTQRKTERAESDVDKGLAQLRLAYRGQRPTEARTTADFEYAALPDTRGENQTDITDTRAHRRAGEFLRNATEDAADAEAYHAQGLLYLADKEFDAALEEFDSALKLTPDNAKLHSDLGAVYLERANHAKESGNQSEVSRNIESSLQHLNRALELDGNLLEALFNKALVLQKIPAPNQAREAWQKYLEKDSTSPWANEARRRLQELESQKSQIFSGDDLEKAFLDAFRQKDDAEAGRLISQNRELIKERYLPQRLAISFVKASGSEKDEYLQALIYTGALEEKNIGDSFAKDLAAFYSRISDADLELIKQAQAATQNSYKLCLDSKIKDSLAEATRARELFLQAGDVYEARLSQFLIVYCLIKNDGIGDSLPVARELADFCRQSNYKWLLSHSLYWLAAAQRVTGDRATANLNYKECLALAKETGDPQILQKILISFANQSKFIGEDQASLDYLQQAFDALAGAQGLSLREKWRSYSDGVEILSSSGLYSLAKAVSLENFQVAKDLGESSFIAYSQLDNGIVNSQTEDFAEARTWLNEARQNAETSSEGDDRTELLAKSLLTLGYLERKLNNYSQAAKFYDEALRIAENSETRFFLYEIEKARLLTNIFLDKDAEVEQQISRTINLAETYRQQIPDENMRRSFFNNQQDIYDIAVLNAYKHARQEQAYNYLESSNARNLLDWLKNGINVKNEKDKIKNIEVTFKANTQPLRLDEIRAQMPEQVQILQYAVLENKVLVWLISKDNFTVVPSEIEAEKLNEKVTAYADLISAQDDKKQEEAKRLARELYDLLISPVGDRLDPKREICVIPHKTLFRLPFAALTAPDGKPFLAQFNFFYAPSANVFLLFTKNARQKSALVNESLLSVGNPHFNRNEFKNLQDLPKAEGEAREIALLYPNPQSPKPLIGDAATKSALQNSLANAEVIHFAGHYLVRNGDPLSSGLVLTQSENGNDAEDGILTNAELISQTLPRAKLVVLSACQTGYERYYNGEGLIGLSRTFLAAGAPLVVASQWQVDSGATAALMKKFHRFRRQEKLSTTAALRRAQLEMMESPDPNLRQPYFWAAFATYGGYAEF
jgi:CHAT domain-containing protein